MKRLFIITVFCSMLMLAAGCGATHHTITKSDGSTVVSVGQPKFSKDSNSYTFENLDGEQVILKREDVKEIRENKD